MNLLYEIMKSQQEVFGLTEKEKRERIRQILEGGGQVPPEGAPSDPPAGEQPEAEPAVPGEGEAPEQPEPAAESSEEADSAGEGSPAEDS